VVELIISPEVLANIRAQCPRRAAELEAVKSAAAQASAPPVPATPATTSDVSLGSGKQAQRFAALF
jgi:hypothetical protein